MIAHSQLAPLPKELPFQIVSKTIGQGAYACIKKARPVDSPTPIFAVKFIHKAFSIRNGRISLKQLNLEITLHKHLGHHPNIVQFFQSGEDDAWKWIAMELAEGGDLFDKIESDVGVGEDIAHFYFTQLISAVSYMHSRGVGHRDIKPENILLSAEGNLKIADFGLATLFSYNGQRKICKTSCGSPPYTAPEVVNCDSKTALSKHATGYYGDLVDIWSCGVVLFVLLAGNTPWDEPLLTSYEFHDYVQTNGRPTDELWSKLPMEPLSLLRGMMKVDASTRFSLDDVRRHPWFTRMNPYLSPDGRLINPLALATQMFESMRVDFSAESIIPNSQDPSSMDLDSQPATPSLASTQPQTPGVELPFDWEFPAAPTVSASQPIGLGHFPAGTTTTLSMDDSFVDRLATEPSFSQFSASPSVPLTTTQAARRFHDILPAHTLTRFFSTWALAMLVPLLATALARLGVVVADPSTPAIEERTVWLRVRLADGRRCPMSGVVVLERLAGDEEGLCSVTFVKGKGDPVEWRRFFKRLVGACQEAVCRPGS